MNIGEAINKVKKDTYKENPDAYFKSIKNGIAYYYADLNEYMVQYEIPLNDMGTASFNRSMPAKLLNRWITSTSRVESPSEYDKKLRD